ncbi:MAG: hypothetical protein AAGI01_00765 [Myxococcota bacterium]
MSGVDRAREASFLVCACNSCAREVLAHRALGDEGQLVWACVVCDEVLDEFGLRSRWVTGFELDELGYVVEGLEEPDRHGGGGCRGAQCGVRQPDA